MDTRHRIHARSLRREDGQSTVEFALMIPVLFLVFFWMLEVNILFTALHQMSYASYASARSIVSAENPGHGAQLAREVTDQILDGELYAGARPNVQPARRSDSTVQGVDGVRLRFSAFPQLGDFSFAGSIPTHLGPVESDPSLYGDNRGRGGRGTRRMFTDNNVEDF